MSELPKISEPVVNAIVEWLLDRENMLRPPEPTAKFLLLCVKLHRLRNPFPKRAEAADHLGCSVGMIDVAIAQRLAIGDITIRVAGVPGRLSPLPGIRRFIPSPEIVKVVEDAEGSGS